MNDTVMFLVRLNRFFCVQIPNDNLFIIARHNVCGSWRKLAIPDPIFMFFQCVLKSSINCRPNFDKLVITAGWKQESITAEPNWPDSGIMSFDQGDFFDFGVKINFPELEWLIAGGRNQQIAVGTELKVMDLILKIRKGLLCDLWVCLGVLAG